MGMAPVLGPITFQDFEVPEQITFGGRQKLVVHMLPGGARVIDAMGPEDGPIAWSGIFSGQSAAERVRALDRLRQSGASLPLTWGGWRYQVIIQNFQANSTKETWIPYRIQLCVAPSPSEIAVDWLAGVAAPALSIAVTDMVGATSMVSAATADLGSASLGTVVAASGTLAQAVTWQAFNGSLR